jgi:hypothetical protein
MLAAALRRVDRSLLKLIAATVAFNAAVVLLLPLYKRYVAAVVATDTLAMVALQDVEPAPIHDRITPLLREALTTQTPGGPFPREVSITSGFQAAFCLCNAATPASASPLRTFAANQGFAESCMPAGYEGRR